MREIIKKMSCQNIGAWLVFTVALLTYGLTVEPTVSFWDAGEYIATSAKLQVGHPPGAPLFQIIGAFAALFAFGDPERIALLVNAVSVISSAITILLTYQIIHRLIRRIIGHSETPAEELKLVTASVIGALALCFSDSFWFNAVETEVYAMASLMMALLLYLGIRWTDELKDEKANRWVLLISFVVGLVFGIQFMGFLAIPSIGLLYYFKKYHQITIKNFIVAHVSVVALLFLVFKFSLTYILKLFGAVEIFMINSIGLPFNSGSIFLGIVLTVAFLYTIKRSNKASNPIWSLLTHSVFFFFLGLSTWLMLPIRANAGTVVNENNPEDARALLAYYNREQYPAPESPFYGSYYSDYFAAAGPDQDGKPKYEKNHKLGRYEIINNYKGAIQGPNPDHIGLLPRMWSPSSAENYMKFYGRLDFSIRPEYIGNSELRKAVNEFKTRSAQAEIETAQYLDFLKNFSDYIEIKPPTIAQNLTYLFDFQFGYMYWRYFMWNFAGRASDEQGRFNAQGEWLSGIPIMDSVRLGNQNDLPKDLKENKARNTYYFLPLILGLIGVYFHAKRDWKSFWSLLVFFVFTGLAIQFYTNPTLFQPRERDYSLVGSFFIFCIWIGLGAYAVFERLRGIVQQPQKQLALGSLLIFIPLLMAFENWDDHDRSNRYTARATAKAYLDSCLENKDALLFTIGDNDTFPLWYLQEIEGYRTDVRIVNSSLLATDWYIDQMKRQAYESSPIPSKLAHQKYRYGTRDLLYYQPVPEIQEERWLLADFMDWVSSDRKETKISYLLEKQGADLSQFEPEQLDIVYYPTHKIRVPVNKEAVLKSGIVKPQDSELIVDYIDIDLPQSALAKNRLLMLDILNTNDWKRPIYFSGGSLDSAEYLYMKDYLQLDGLVFKLVPILTPDNGGFDIGRIDSQLMYDIVMNWDWGNSEDESIYIDTQTRAQGITFRSNLARLAEQLIVEDRIEMAEEVLDLGVTKMPLKTFKFYTFVEPFIQGYYGIRKDEKAQELSKELLAIYLDRLRYYASLDADESYLRIEEIYRDLEACRRVIDISSDMGDNKFIDPYTDEFNTQLEQLIEVLESSGEYLVN